jgi:hypothetical protein
MKSLALPVISTLIAVARSLEVGSAAPMIFSNYMRSSAFIMCVTCEAASKINDVISDSSKKIIKKQNSDSGLSTSKVTVLHG